MYKYIPAAAFTFLAMSAKPIGYAFAASSLVILSYRMFRESQTAISISLTTPSLMDLA